MFAVFNRNMYHLDARKVALRLYSRLQSFRKTAKLLGVSHSSVQRWAHRVERKPYAQRCKPKYDALVDVVKLAIASDPFVSIRKLRRRVKEACDVSLSTELVRIALKRMGFSKKKARHVCRPAHLPSRTATFLEMRAQFRSQGRKFVSIDETSFGRNGLNTRGYARVGERLYVASNGPRMSTVSAVVCVDENGVVGRKTVPGSFNRVRFLEFLQSLSPLTPGTVVLLDIVSFHHSKEVHDWFRERELTVLHTPPYSPWFNPIELCFSIIKRRYYQTACIEDAFSELTPHHCRQFFERSISATAAF